MDAGEEEKLRNRVTAFEQETAIRKAVQPTMITTFGLNANSHSSDIAVSLDMNALFCS